MIEYSDKISLREYESTHVQFLNPVLYYIPNSGASALLLFCAQDFFHPLYIMDSCFFIFPIKSDGSYVEDTSYMINKSDYFK